MAIIDFRGEYRWLSNFSEAEVVLVPGPQRGIGHQGVDGYKTYKTTEHAYQAAKTLNPEERREIREAKTPGKARRLGQKVKIRDDWEEIKLSVMEALLEQKFDIPEYRDLLLGTENHHLVEGNTWGDVFWGVCNGFGENYLGRLLMKIRRDLRKRNSEDSSEQDLFDG
jgi:N-glycosidase YbiA